MTPSQIRWFFRQQWPPIFRTSSLYQLQLTSPPSRRQLLSSVQGQRHKKEAASILSCVLDVNKCRSPPRFAPDPSSSRSLQQVSPLNKNNLYLQSICLAQLGVVGLRESGIRSCQVVSRLCRLLNTMTVYSFYIFDRHGKSQTSQNIIAVANTISFPAECIYKRRWLPRPTSTVGKSSRPTSDTPTVANGLTSVSGPSTRTTDDDAKLIFGTVFSLRNMVRKLGGEDDK